MFDGPHIPMLAEGDWGGLIWLIVLAVFWIIGTISKSLQEKKESGGSSSKPSPGSKPAPGERGKTVRQRLNELAEQRRRQLQEIARQKQDGHERQTKPQSTPRNQTTAVPTQSREADTDISLRREAGRRATAQHLEAAEHRAEELRRTAERARAQRDEVERQRRLQQKAAAMERERMAVEPTQPGHMTGDVHRHVDNAPVPLEQIPVHPNLITTREGLRQAIIMKEVLDKPIALRDPAAYPIDW